MIGVVLSILATALSLLVVDIIFPGVDLANFPVAMLAGAVIGLLNGLVKPILTLLSLPLTILTLGGFLLVVNGFCFWLASVLVPGFIVKGLLAFLAAPVVLALVNSFINKYLAETVTTKFLSSKDAPPELK
ncbi:MAG: phage holin family protein [Cyanobacteriota bacterium ELA615]